MTKGKETDYDLKEIERDICNFFRKRGKPHGMIH